MARQSKHIRFQVAHKAAQMMVEEGISDYAFAKRKAANFFGLMDGDVLPSNNEINDAIKEHQAIFLNKEHEGRLKALRLEALNLMKKLSAFNPHLIGGILDGAIGRYPKTHIELYADSMKEIEFFLLNLGIPYETRDLKLKKIPILIIAGSQGPIELMIFDIGSLKFKRNSGSIKYIERLILA
ncbi:hypothetical protein FIT80_06075 [Candidatus Methylopumilus universalis]|uniref:hypothetical protein n=1 Tax=Candidatus Methylopumilus universalis TaxID=2588536 RepID=UPI00111CCB05|nr:hypothetical protein [Candidatus Methylopumilus universalis]QDC89738.1 hypothetical protein FIT79_06010 [Candidatus Methylopumilus universalis]QDC91039.1 hypothetical protein FIT80_06075 [Candidatus Methylopumilus universalis]